MRAVPDVAREFFDTTNSIELLARIRTELSLDFPAIAYLGSVRITAAQWARGYEATEIRSNVLHAKGRYQNARHHRGANNWRSRHCGVTAEVIVQELFAGCPDVEQEAIIADKPVKRPDLRLDSHLIELKSAPLGAKNRVCINCGTHTTKPVSGYLIARLTTTLTADLFFTASAPVADWSVGDGGSKYFHAPLPSFLPSLCEPALYAFEEPEALRMAA